MHINLELDFQDDSEIDFWNASLCFWSGGNELSWNATRSRTSRKNTEVLSTTAQLFLEVESFITSLESKNPLIAKELTGDFHSSFFKKIKKLSESSTKSSELLALKALARISAVKYIDSEYLFQSFGFSNWIEKMGMSDSPQIFLEAWRIGHNLHNKNSLLFMDGIYPVMPPSNKQKTVADIVLVHGIMGGAAWTWRQHDSKKENPILGQDQRLKLFKDGSCHIDSINGSYSWMWPLDWLPLKIKKPFRLIAVDYPAFWWKWSDKYVSNDLDLNSLSKEFLQRLKAAGVGSRPIIWIAHSMGGLIVKKMLELESDLELSSNSESRSQINILSSTRGIIFLSVPHFGSPLASWSCRFSSILRPSPYIYNMKAGDPDLLSLNKSFLRNCHNHSIEVLTLNEGKSSVLIKNGPRFKFVSSKYGDPGIGDIHEVDSTHLEVCKPIDMSDQIFQFIENFIFKIMDHL